MAAKLTESSEQRAERIREAIAVYRLQRRLEHEHPSNEPSPAERARRLAEQLRQDALESERKYRFVRFIG